MNQPKAVFRGVIVLYFVIGLEILIMISPAAGLFYAAFNPFLLSLSQSPATRWLTAFFLPHMGGTPGAILVYFMPKDYVMQGMIADTGGEWQLYKRHHTFAMIGDWIFHPFRHLEDGHAAMHHGTGEGTEGHRIGTGLVRRMVFLRVEAQSDLPNPADLFGINTRRSPLFVADVGIHNLVLQDVRDLPPETGWGRVPTPIF